MKCNVSSLNHLICNFNGFNADRANPFEQINHRFFVIREKVSVELRGDGRVGGFLLFVLVENPFEGGAIAEFVFLSHRRNIVQNGVRINFDNVKLFVGFQLRARGG